MATDSNNSQCNTMQLLLVENQPVSFDSTPISTNYNGVYYYLRSATVPIAVPNLIDVPPSILNLFERLKNSDENSPDSIWQVRIDAGIAESKKREGSSGNHIYSGFLKLDDIGSPGLLEPLSSNLGWRLKLKVDLGTIGGTYYRQTGYGEFAVDSIEEYVVRHSPLATFGCEKNNVDFEDLSKSFSYWKSHSHSFTGTITITAIVPEENISIGTEDPSVDDKLCITKKLLKQEINCDLEIIPTNGIAVKCHRNFLSAHSPVFETMFKGEMKETKTSTVEIIDMTETSVRAFLAYLYYWETKEATNNSLICFELYHAGHKYDISTLEECMKKILLSKDDEWYDVDVAMRLFLFARNLEDGNELKVKAIQILKSKISILTQSKGYQELFKKDPNAAMELCTYAFSI